MLGDGARREIGRTPKAGLGANRGGSAGEASELFYNGVYGESNRISGDVDDVRDVAAR